MEEASGTIRINRAPVLTLWAAMVAERLGFGRATASTLGRAVAGFSAHANGVSLGITKPKPDLVGERGDRLAEVLLDLGRVAGLALVDRAQPVRGPRHGHRPAEQVDMQPLALGHAQDS